MIYKLVIYAEWISQSTWVRIASDGQYNLPEERVKYM